MNKIRSFTFVFLFVSFNISAQLTLNVTTSSPTNCITPCNGTATVTNVSPVIPGTTYEWNTSPIQTGTTATALCPGTYSVTATAHCSAPMITADSLLTNGDSVSINYTAPGTGGSTVAIVHSNTNALDSLWMLINSPFNVAVGNGYLNMSYNGNGSFSWDVNFTGMDTFAINGYPSVLYGADIFNNQLNINNQAPKFPVTVDTLCSLISDITYSLTGSQMAGNMDVLFDEFLMPYVGYQGGQAGALEVEIIPYFNFAYGKYGTYIKTINKPVVLNGIDTIMHFEEYVGLSGVGGDVLFYGDGPPSGHLRIDIADFFTEAIANGGGGVVDSTWLVPGILLGTEFGDASDVNFNFLISKFSIEESLKTSPYNSTASATINCLTTDVNTISSEKNIRLSPNPATNKLNLQFNSVSEMRNIDCIIINILGKQLYKQSLDIKSETNKQIDISDFPAGIYFIQLINGEQFEQIKFIKE